MEPTAALQSVETVLRTAINRVFEGEIWLQAPGAPKKEDLVLKRTAEEKRRDGVVVSSNLLEYAEIHHLTAIIIHQASWEKFKPIFEDKKRIEAYFEIVKDVRNAIAHSRTIVPYERELLSGAAQHLSNLLSLHGLSDDATQRYYPTIEDVVDSFGTAGRPLGKEHWYAEYADTPTPRLEVGQVVKFSGRAVSARGKDITWYWMTSLPNEIFPQIAEIGTGLELNYEWTVTEKEVREYADYTVYIVSESNYHRHSALYLGGNKVPADDARHFTYSINPPVDD